MLFTARSNKNTASQDHREAVFAALLHPLGATGVPPKAEQPGYRAPTFQVIKAPGVIADAVTLQTDQFRVFAAT